MNLLVYLLLLFFASNPSVKPNREGTPTNSDAKVQRESPITVVNNSETTPNHDNHNDKTPPWYTTVEWANWALVGVGFAGVCAAIRSLNQMKEQTDIARRAADAAFANAQAVINAERPFVMVTAKFERWTIYVSGEVKGRTPANIISGWGNDILVPNKESLPDQPPYVEDGTKVAHQFLALPNEQPFPIYQYPVDSRLRFDNKIWYRIESCEDVLFVFGRVIYEDILSKDDKGKPVQHVTRWSYRFFPAGLVLQDGKPSYIGYS